MQLWADGFCAFSQLHGELPKWEHVKCTIHSHGPTLVRRTPVNLTQPCQTSVRSILTLTLRSADGGKGKWLHVTKYRLQAELGQEENYEFRKTGKDSKPNCWSDALLKNKTSARFCVKYWKSSLSDRKERSGLKSPVCSLFLLLRWNAPLTVWSEFGTCGPFHGRHQLQGYGLSSADYLTSTVYILPPAILETICWGLNCKSHFTKEETEAQRAFLCSHGW